jgi:GNAT superfamily N-acetyltransferase
MESQTIRLYILGVMDDKTVTKLSFSGGQRKRIRQRGEFGMSVRKQYWSPGIGSLMFDTLFDYARATQIIKKMKKDFLNGRYFDVNSMGLEL